MDINQTPVQIIANVSQQIIHDISFDWYGKRIATCSSDKTIKIYIKKNDGSWAFQNQIKSQGGPLWRVKWARPQFGLILATCSLDRNVKIYQKKKNEWIQQFKIFDSKQGIQDIKFSPKHASGLLLATASSDGYLRIYQAPDTQNLKNWILKHSIMINQLGLNCLSWNKSPFEKTMIVVGCKDVKTNFTKTLSNISTESQTSNNSKNKQTPTLAFLMFQQNDWLKMQISDQQKLPITQINDVSWSLLNGRSYHLLAIASDKFVKIYYFKINEMYKKNTLSGCGIRLSWNIMVTHLAVSQPKRIRIYKSINSVWSEVKKIQNQSIE